MERNPQLDWQGLVREAIKRRKENKLSQKHLAALAGLNHLGVIKFEKMQENLELKTAFAILRVLGLLKASQLVRQESMKINAEFEAIENDPEA